MSPSRLILTGLLALSPAVAAAADKGFVNRVWKDADGTEAKYVLFVPHHHEAGKPLPIMLFLHGSGETGTDGVKQSQVGLGKHVREHEKTFPFVVVFPQSQKRTWRADSPDTARALAILEATQKEFKTDPKRVYLTGLSMGGFGTWGLAKKYPDRWAAIAPICGGGDPEAADKIKHIPCWVFHGADDPAVPVKASRDMVEALKKAGGSPKYDEYPGVKHQSWDKAYATKDLFPWFLKHTTK